MPEGGRRGTGQAGVLEPKSVLIANCRRECEKTKQDRPIATGPVLFRPSSGLPAFAGSG